MERGLSVCVCVRVRKCVCVCVMCLCASICTHMGTCVVWYMHLRVCMTFYNDERAECVCSACVWGHMYERSIRINRSGTEVLKNVHSDHEIATLPENSMLALLSWGA